MFFDIEINCYVDILLFGVLWVEGDGVMINFECNMMLMCVVVVLFGDVLFDWCIVVEVVCVMGFGDVFDYVLVVDVFDEIVCFLNFVIGYDLCGVSYVVLCDGFV